MKKLVIATIRLYQKTISPDHGWFSGGEQHVCRFYPTCSQYTIDAIEKYGIIKGIGLGLWRILRCNPWNKGGHDPVK
jgi:putative membrane protein insertion efficiency factor